MGTNHRHKHHEKSNRSEGPSLPATGAIDHGLTSTPTRPLPQASNQPTLTPLKGSPSHHAPSAAEPVKAKNNPVAPSDTANTTSGSGPSSQRTGLQKSYSILLQDNNLQLSGLLEKKNDHALGKSYRAVQQRPASRRRRSRRNEGEEEDDVNVKKDTNKADRPPSTTAPAVPQSPLSTRTPGGGGGEPVISELGLPSAKATPTTTSPAHKFISSEGVGRVRRSSQHRRSDDDRSSSSSSASSDTSSEETGSQSRHEGHAPPRTPAKSDVFPGLWRRGLSFDTSLKQRQQLHLQSADLFDNFSPVQKERQMWIPSLPDAFNFGMPQVCSVEAPELVQSDGDKLLKLHPRTFGQSCCLIQCQADASGAVAQGSATRRALRVGLVLSGGPAPGGHNVIAGVYDYIRNCRAESQLFGFLGGLDGLFQNKHRLVTDTLMDRFRNQGGFDMLWSGRGRINGKQDLMKAKEICQQLELHGLIIIGGDGSNSNAALLSEYFGEHLPTCSVIGVPKTIDGDLRNPWIETSFGFDTAAKTYSELIGNLCTDVTTGQRCYHFVRIMGRSASHLVLECALQTRPNLVFIGEEVEANRIGLRAIVNDITDLIIERAKLNKVYGIILIPEGLIEFIPEIKTLINELNSVMSKASSAAIDQSTARNNTSATTIITPEAIASRLSPESREVWTFLPEVFQEQLLMDRESSGYIQVAKIATERLLKLLTEKELQRRGFDNEEYVAMPHYFGYEGRCAMPSNFDANYCCSLGYTAGCLIEHRKNGYMAVVRHLDQHVSMWQPAAIPFTRIMQIKTCLDGNPDFPAVTRQLVDLEGPLFKVLQKVRQAWKFEDCYRCPGPIQFEGPVADIADYTVSVPTEGDLLWGPSAKLVGEGRAVCPKRPGALGLLQKHRLQYRPEIPSICLKLDARAVSGAQYLPKDPYTQRQILAHYPYTCESNHFQLQEVISDSATPQVGAGLRVGVVFLSRQAPGVVNVLWGIYERLKLVKGKCIGFYGLEGLMSGKHLEVTSQDLELYLNQGGMELLGRAAGHSLLTKRYHEKAMKTCEKLRLDGLIIIGSSLAMTEASLTAEYFLSKGCRTAVIGIPATGSNNLTHDLIETNIGFDTSSKLYANLIGNVLTEAASMPKYWHFVRLMGRQPSNEVLECALQTHPNIVIIAEEYGAAGKTLGDVVMDIADVVCRRAEMGKNFGSVLIPDGLLSHLPNMKYLMNELGALVEEAQIRGQIRDLQAQLDQIDGDVIPTESSNWIARITPWSMALYKSLPKFIRKELTAIDMGEMRFTLIETELLLSQMVRQELERRKREGTFIGKFDAVTHFFGYQGRSSMPSQFDCKLAFAYGHLAAICVESGLTAHCCTIRGLCGTAEEWKLGAIPFNCMLAFIAQQQDIHPDLKGKQGDMPIIPSAEVNLNAKAFRWMKTAVSQWQEQDRFCNPGPVQFNGNASTFYHRMLHEEQAEYFNMLKHVQLFTNLLKDTCSFGVQENFLKVAFVNLNALLTLRFHPDDVMSFVTPFADVKDYESWQRNEGRRPEVWQSSGSMSMEDQIGRGPSRPSLAGIATTVAAGIRLMSRTGLGASTIRRRPLSATEEGEDSNNGNGGQIERNDSRLTTTEDDRDNINNNGSSSKGGVTSPRNAAASEAQQGDEVAGDARPRSGSRIAAFINRLTGGGDAGWGDEIGVEAYPTKSTTTSPSTAAAGEGSSSPAAK